MVGQYLILKEYLEHTPLSDLEVTLIYHPFSFDNNLDQAVTFNYFMKPFYKKVNFQHFSNLVFDQVKKIPLHYLIYVPFFRETRLSPFYKQSEEDHKISSISIEYLKKIEALCKEKGIKSFKVKCPFVSNKYSMRDFEFIKNDSEKHHLSELFQGYFDQIVFLDDKKFYDSHHLENFELGYNYLNL